MNARKAHVTHHDTLGVPSDASRAEIAAAYRRLAKQVHPDAHPSASLEDRRARESAMARLNLAYSAARGAAARLAVVREPEEPVRFPPTPPGACDVCGASPVDTYVVKLRSAWMASALHNAPELELCDACARTLGLVLPREPSPAPSAGPGAPSPHSTPRRHPQRLIRLVLAAALVTIATFVAITTVPSSPQPPTVAVGGCVRWSGRYVAVSCGDPHSGRVVSVASAPSACPARASFAHRKDKTYCIDTSQ